MIFKKNGQYHIAWHGATNEASGYGGSNLAMIKALESTKVRTHPLDIRGDEGEICAADCEVGVVYAPGNFGHFEKLTTPYKILFTMFEADRWPREWINACNAANQVWVPSIFCRDAAIASGVVAPISIVPLGVNPKVYFDQKDSQDSGFRGQDSGVYTFGFAGTASFRKGYDVAVRAFLEEFTHDEPVRLLIRSSSILSSTIPKDKRIQLIPGDVSVKAMQEFYRDVDCFVFPTRGEGVGLTPMEAMACGCCTAVTDWGGCRDYLGDHCLRIATDGLESAAQYHESGGKWARPSLASTRYCMRWAFEHPVEARELGKKAAKFVAKNFTYEHTAKAIEKLVKQIDPHERIETEIRQVVVWHGDPRQVTTSVGGFTRGVPRELTDEQIAKLNPADVREKGFNIEQRLRRIA